MMPACFQRLFNNRGYTRPLCKSGNLDIMRACASIVAARKPGRMPLGRPCPVEVGSGLHYRAWRPGRHFAAGVVMMQQVRGQDRDIDTQYAADVRDIAAGAFVDETHHIVASALVLGGILLGYAIWLARTRALEGARTVFSMSNNYLALLFAMMVLDRVLH